MCVFFFKQKTAYEMRIIDWSSDVCSSDLGRVGTRGERSGGLGIVRVAERPLHRDGALARAVLVERGRTLRVEFEAGERRTIVRQQEVVTGGDLATAGQRGDRQDVVPVEVHRERQRGRTQRVWPVERLRADLRVEAAVQQALHGVRSAGERPVDLVVGTSRLRDVQGTLHVLTRGVRHALPVLHSHDGLPLPGLDDVRSEEHTSELQSLMRISYAVFCLNTKHNLKIHVLYI